MRDNRGYTHIYCGDGKGKTTAAMGLCVRAAGRGKKILLFQFLKDNSSGELNILSGLSNVTIKKAPESMKFTIDMSQNEKELLKAYYEAEFRGLASAAEAYDMLILDEILYVIYYGLFDEELLLQFLQTKPENLEVVLTGQHPDERLIALADYVSEIKKIKHPYDRGVRSRRGIEI
jgi:cob(I)alamin adenosyltransferase